MASGIVIACTRHKNEVRPLLGQAGEVYCVAWTKPYSVLHSQEFILVTHNMIYIQQSKSNQYMSYQDILRLDLLHHSSAEGSHSKTVIS